VSEPTRALSEACAITQIQSASTVVRSALANFFDDDSDDPTVDGMDGAVTSLARPHRELLEFLIASPEWALEDVTRRARDLGLFVRDALQRINAYAENQLDDQGPIIDIVDGQVFVETSVGVLLGVADSAA
jgi:hypothetical protein